MIKFNVYILGKKGQNWRVLSALANAWCQFDLLLVMLILTVWLEWYLPEFLCDYQVSYGEILLSILFIILLPTNWQAFMFFALWVFFPHDSFPETISVGFTKWWFSIFCFHHSIFSNWNSVKISLPFFFFFWLHLQRAEVPEPGIKPVLQLRHQGTPFFNQLFYPQQALVFYMW